MAYYDDIISLTDTLIDMGIADNDRIGIMTASVIIKLNLIRFSIFLLAKKSWVQGTLVNDGSHMSCDNLDGCYFNDISEGQASQSMLVGIN